MTDHINTLITSTLDAAECATKRPWECHDVMPTLVEIPSRKSIQVERWGDAHYIVTAANNAVALAKALKIMSEALEDIEKHCLCERFETKGFDYGELHLRLGKPGVGKRWITPSDVAHQAKMKADAIAKEVVSR